MIFFKYLGGYPPQQQQPYQSPYGGNPQQPPGKIITFDENLLTFNNTETNSACVF
jgi:hypothetical protein